MERDNTYRIQDIECDDRPRERLAEMGAGALSDAELLAILLRVGIQGENAIQMGQRLLRDLGGIIGLQRVSFIDLARQRGLGIAKSAQIKAALELGKRIAQREVEQRTGIHRPQDAVDLMRPEMEALDHEQLWVLLLDTRNKLLRRQKMYQGSLNSSTVRVGELFKPAIQYSAAGMMMLHNHPSGDPTPSPEDVHLTRAVAQSGKLMDIELIDHIIIGGEGRYTSLRDKGLGFS